MPETTLYRRHPALMVSVEDMRGTPQVTMSTWDGQPPLVVDDPRLTAAVSQLPLTKPFARTETFDAWESSGLGEICLPLWAYCRDRALIVRDSDDEPHPHAGYHGATRSYPFLDMSRQSAFAEDNQLMRTYMASSPYPPVYAELPHSRRRPLPAAEDTLGRMGGLTLIEELALLLDGTLGERHRLDYADHDTYIQLELIRKAVPSGGSRHPTEALVHLRNGGFPDGLYHFNVRARALDRLLHQPTPATLAEACPGLSDLLTDSRPTAVVVLASMVERAMWRYRDPRSARAVVFDVGHVVQHLAEVGNWLGWTWIDLPGTHRRTLASRLHLDPEAMPVMAVGVLRK